MPGVAEIEAKFGLGERLNITGKRFRCNFIKPGLVSYIDKGAAGYELLRKETIDKYLNSMIGEPLIIEHVSTFQPVPPNRIKGRCDKVGYDLTSGWYFCEGNVEASQAEIDHINSLESVSCGYRVPPAKDSYGPGGSEHNIPYIAEIRALKFHHIAVTSSAPRYEDAIIRLNAKTQETPAMSKFTWIKKILGVAPATGGAPVETSETGEIAADAGIEIEGETVRLNDLVEGHKAAKVEADTKKKEDDAKKKAEADNKLNALTGDTLIEIDGVRVKVSELVAERQNAIKAKKDKEAADQVERENAKKAGAESYKILAEARNQPVQVTPIAQSSDSQSEQLARGREMFGSGRN